MTSAHAIAYAALFVALGGTSYAQLSLGGGDDGSAVRTAPSAGAPAAKAPTNPGVLDTSFVYQTNYIMLPASPPQYSQVNFLSSSDPAVSGGVLQVTEPGELHAEAMLRVRRNPGTGRSAWCQMLVNGSPMSHFAKATFSDTGREPDGSLAYPTVTLPLVGSINVEPGTYNVGVRCYAQEANLVEMSRTDLHAVVYRR